MDHPYSFWADVLSKFQGSPPWIQALWLVLAAVVVLGAIWCLADVLKHAVGMFAQGKANARLAYGLVQDADGRWLVCIEGEATPAEVLGRRVLGEGSEVPAGGTRSEILPPRG